MSVNIDKWFTVIKQTVEFMADEEATRRAWFGIGPEVDSPGENFCQFFGDAAVMEFLDRTDHGLTPPQFAALKDLAALMRKLSDETPDDIDTAIGAELINDPRWKEIISASDRFLKLLPEMK